MSDDALSPPPPDTFVVGEFTVHLRPGLNRTWRAQIADRDGPCMIVRGLGRERATRRARVVREGDEKARGEAP